MKIFSRSVDVFYFVKLQENINCAVTLVFFFLCFVISHLILLLSLMDSHKPVYSTEFQIYSAATLLGSLPLKQNLNPLKVLPERGKRQKQVRACFTMRWLSKDLLSDLKTMMISCHKPC